MNTLRSFFKKETVLCIAALAAVISCFFVPPSLAYFSYIDYRVLALLFSLMAIVAGLRQDGVFDWLSARLVGKVRTSRGLMLTLVLLAFFSSMVIANDVALITFVPFAMLVLTAAGLQEQIITTLTLQTIAANLGSMLTPVGNPQNLYLYSTYDIPVIQFFQITLPVTAVSLVLLVIVSVCRRSVPVTPKEIKNSADINKRGLYINLALFTLTLLSVLRVVHYLVPLIVTAAVLLLTDRTRFQKVDWGLLATFVCFFIFVGNIGRMETVSGWIASAMEGREMLFGILVSQVISNVPAAALLSAFTDNARALLLGTNIGGLGTLVASLASLISYKAYAGSPGAAKNKYLLKFTIYNLLFLLLLAAIFI